MYTHSRLRAYNTADSEHIYVLYYTRYTIYKIQRVDSNNEYTHMHAKVDRVRKRTRHKHTQNEREYGNDEESKVNRKTNKQKNPTFYTTRITGTLAHMHIYVTTHLNEKRFKAD